MFEHVLFWSLALTIIVKEMMVSVKILNVNCSFADVAPPPQPERFFGGQLIFTSVECRSRKLTGYFLNMNHSVM